MRERIHRVRDRARTVRADIGDAELFGMLVEGDPRALRASWLRFAPLVHCLLKRALGPEDDVREHAQLVFDQLFRRASELRHPNALRLAVIALTTSVIRTELRARWSRRWLRIRPAQAPPRTSIAPPHPPSQEAMRRLYLILDKLKSEDRIAFAFHFLQGLSLEEVAGALDLSLPAAQRVLARVWSRTVTYLEHDGALLEFLASLEEQGACA
jgi:DNA-directed RNA polymerase specialized sigma24 family protein